MSYVSQTTRGKPAGFTAAVIINGGIIAAVALSPVTILPPHEPPVTIAENIPIAQPPPPVDDPKTVVDPPPLPPIFAPPSQTPIKPVDGPTTTTDPVDPYTPTFDGKGKDMGKLAKKAQDAPKALPKLLPVFKAAIRDPRWARLFQPPYPTRMLQREIEGSARVKILIGTDGRVREATLVSATYPDFGKATVRHALKKWRFKPATRDGVAVEDWQTLTVKFTLNG